MIRESRHETEGFSPEAWGPAASLDFAWPEADRLPGRRSLAFSRVSRASTYLLASCPRPRTLSAWSVAAHQRPHLVSGSGPGAARLREGLTPRRNSMREVSRPTHSTHRSRRGLLLLFTCALAVAVLATVLGAGAALGEDETASPAAERQGRAQDRLDGRGRQPQPVHRLDQQRLRGLRLRVPADGGPELGHEPARRGRAASPRAGSSRTTNSSGPSP